MKIIVGLGNPGEKYKNNRHNVGHMFIDYIAPLLHCSIVKKEKLYITMKQSNNRTIVLVKPLTFMNNSGLAVKRLISKSPNLSVSNFIVVHDDLDIPLGKFKFQKGVGPRLHNGIESIEKALDTIPHFPSESEGSRGKDFWRIRIGVDNRINTDWIDGETYVLQNFTHQEKKSIESIFPKILSHLSLLSSSKSKVQMSNQIQNPND